MILLLAFAFIAAANVLTTLALLRQNRANNAAAHLSDTERAGDAEPMRFEGVVDEVAIYGTELPTTTPPPNLNTTEGES